MSFSLTKLEQESINISREKFLKLAAASIGSLALSSFYTKEYLPPIGMCGSWEDSAVAKQCGCEYIEEGVSKILMPTKPEREFKQQLEKMLNAKSLDVRCFNLFIPGELKSVGENANHEGIINHASIVFERAKMMGAKVITFGSSGSRSIPDGFEKTKAKEQFISLCTQLAPLAGSQNITIAIEQLNRGETNFLNTMQEVSEIVDAVNYPHLKMTCDVYHAIKENDSASEIIKFKEHIVHCHLAEKEGRTPPGVKGDDFTPYFRALKKIKYRGRISLECKWLSLMEELPIAIRVVKEQYAKA